MERKIGEIFEYNGKYYQTFKSDENKCSKCDLRNENCTSSDNVYTVGSCSSYGRTDKNFVNFKLIDMCKKKEEKRNVELTLEKAIEWYKKGGELREVALQAFNESELKDNRSHSWEEFCNNRKFKGYNAYFGEHGCFPNGNIDVYPSIEYADAVVALSRLLMIRQEWIGDWKPDWSDYHQVKNVIGVPGNDLAIFVVNHTQFVLSFPTEIMAKDFFNDFKDLLETAKPLI